MASACGTSGGSSSGDDATSALARPPRPMRHLASPSARVPPVEMPIRVFRSTVALLPLALVLFALGGCAVKHPTADLVKGKQLFIQKCGVCHTLNHAGTTGTIGPNLDVAFHQDRADGIKGTS